MYTENQLVKSLTGKNSLEDSSIEDWQSITAQYPYFSAAQYFLLKKLQENNNRDAIEQSPKTALYFNDLHWLQYLLLQSSTKEANAQADFPKTETSVVGPYLSTEKEEIEAEEDKNNIPQQATEENPVNSSGEMQTGRLTSVIEAQLAQFKRPVDKEEKLAVETEPLFKTDYFASQGILYAKAKDELGIKVKKFTDWLKDIKKNSNEIPQLQTTAEEEKQIAAKALASLETKEIVTESMAEVLLQQGKRNNAVEVYKKLSLLYPEKSSYFASKIDSLQ